MQSNPAIIIALVSFEALQDWEVDDLPLEAALRANGCTVESPAWDDPGVDWNRFDACLIRTTWNYHDRHEAFLAWARATAQQTALFNPPEVIAWNIRKTYLRELEARGVACIPTIWLDSGDPTAAGAALAQAQFWEQAFLKPVVGANASGTLRLSPADPAQLSTAQRHAEHLGRTGGGLLQPYLRSVETQGEVSGIFVGGVFCHGVRKVPVPGDYRVQDDHGASDEPWGPAHQQLGTMQRVIGAAHDALGHDGDSPLLYARADFLFGDGGELLLTELELIEPSLFFRHGSATAQTLAAELVRRIR